MQPGLPTTLMSTASGTLLTLVSTIHSEDLFKTVILSAVGAASSFVMAAFLGWLVRRFRRNRE